MQVNGTLAIAMLMFCRPPLPNRLTRLPDGCMGPELPFMQKTRAIPPFG
ncbi:hypothetical protein THTE_2887 [Thermogutta terrifontis]|uniref:Uncharacterized protein n=1 Tax=Thermogutta terrifontis TaxID=1331910 RepID=A0A286RHQ7_9BACT|nr:hypothetical protein THTE_2887 [Thermogutta terrifontis]